ncbi:type II secretion system F family protein [Stratiformator vulcanicus]|uniref:Type II secretion system protein F n=1 Tax=Stratiformator vulcanicus TaxID=2527980 RepID=A0A517QX58_9PLAN|nr:type II secretion system F family protein [Stratiformator vulcanicus]QDT36173.1 Putative type II secretion system protein F [Stratiformator vulcanicus]
MPEFRYRATNSEGHREDGRLTAVDESAAQQELKGRGYAIDEIAIENEQPLDVTEFDGEPVLGNESLGLDDYTLEAAMRMVAEEWPSSRHRRAIETAASRLGRGEPPEQVLKSLEYELPPRLTTVVEAGLETGHLPKMLTAFIEATRAQRDRRRGVLIAFTYPTILIAVTGFIAWALLVIVVPMFATIYEGFGTQLPASTLALLKLSELVRGFGWYLLAAIVGLTLLCCFWFRTRRLPWFASFLVRPSELATTCRLLAVLVDADVPLTKSLRLLADTTADARLSRDLARCANLIAEGVPAHSAAAGWRFPEMFRQALHWADRRELFIVALNTQADLLDRRARVFSLILPTILEPISLMIVGGFVLFAVFSLFAPLLKFLNFLS